MVWQDIGHGKNNVLQWESFTASNVQYKEATKYFDMQKHHEVKSGSTWRAEMDEMKYMIFLVCFTQNNFSEKNHWFELKTIKLLRVNEWEPDWTAY